MAAKQTSASSIALGGVLAALAVVVMCLGGLIPVATYVCPMLCALILHVVAQKCGRSVAWAWYAAVAILSLLLGPDKEAGAVFVFLGYYPILKPRLDKLPVSWLWKLLLFNAAIMAMYALLIHLFGMADIAAEFTELGTVLLIVTLAAGNLAFWLLDRLLGMRRRYG